ncbi:MAG: ACP S-malonyltransferase, partial [Gammaproteobacteria bacterium]
NYNAIGQVVIAGHIAAVQRAMGLAETYQAKMARLIPVSVPCHCALLKPAAEKFADALAQTPMSPPKGTVISNVDLSIYHSVEQIRALLQQQLYSPVRWVETIQMMQKAGVETIIECGPGKVLSGLIKRIDKSLTVESAVAL